MALRAYLITLAAWVAIAAITPLSALAEERPSDDLAGLEEGSGEGSDAVFIVDGSPVGTCGWPTTIATSQGCSGTLIHPKAIATAQHCGTPTNVRFGERSASGGHTVAVVGCVGTGSQDAQICELAEAVEGLPITPVLFGCELDKYLAQGEPVVMVGFGQTSYGVGGGTKLWADQSIDRVEAGRVIVGAAGVGASPCPGDSGGPVFIQVDDGSWRIIGTVLGGTTGTPCNSAADFQRLDTVVPNFEEQRGIDITPCFDAATGAWDASEACGTFFAGDETGSGSWADWCTGTAATGYSTQCGAGFDGSTGDGDGDGDGDDDGDGDGDGGSADGDADGGCGCHSGGAPVPGLLILLLVLGVVVLRRPASRA